MWSPVLGQRADPNGQAMSEQVRADKNIGKSVFNMSAQTDNAGRTDAFPASMWTQNTFGPTTTTVICCPRMSAAGPHVSEPKKKQRWRYTKSSRSSPYLLLLRYPTLPLLVVAESPSLAFIRCLHEGVDGVRALAIGLVGTVAWRRASWMWWRRSLASSWISPACLAAAISLSQRVRSMAISSRAVASAAASSASSSARATA
jgi:hypothetical protein